jgi:glyoxylase-like metal-dependent hydrolase (beta-lactamase superfamily II)
MEIYTLDLDFQGVPQTIASYIVVGPKGVVLVETGPQSTLENLLSRLAEHGYSPGDVKQVLVTHIHLDHSGAAGWWAQQGAQVYVHHVGAPHLIDPSKLLSSAGRIYGDQFYALWGKTVPAPADQVISVHDGQKINAAGLTFTAWDTPGHAYHHHIYQLEDIAFTGDAAGIQLPGTYFVDLPAPPPEFNQELWLQTLDRMLTLPLKTIYPTHFGKMEDWKTQLKDFGSLIQKNSDFIRKKMEGGLDRDAILAHYQAEHRRRAEAATLSEADIVQYEVANPQHMSVDGILRYWRKKQHKLAS